MGVVAPFLAALTLWAVAAPRSELLSVGGGRGLRLTDSGADGGSQLLTLVVLTGSATVCAVLVLWHRHPRLRRPGGVPALALAPEEFTLSFLAQLYAAALGHPVDPTNLQRVLTRRRELEACGRSAPPGPSGGRPAGLYRFAERRLRITDQFATLRPPTGSGW